MSETIEVPTAADAALAALDSTQVRLVGVRPAGEVIPAVGPRSFLHSGPPLELEEIPGPMRGALIGALILEGEASGPDEAAAIIDAGEIEIQPNHHAGSAGAMAGVVTPSMPGVVVECNGKTFYSPLNEGLGRALRFGNYDDATLDRLRWMTNVAGPALDAAIAATEEIEMTSVIAEGLRRGDECHNRNVATSAFLIARLGPALVRTVENRDDAASVLSFAIENKHFALAFSVATAKAIADSAHGFAGSPIVTTMSGNGRRFGIRVSGLGDRWFLAPSPLGDARYFEGFTAADATPTMGDSMITETVGYGGFVLTAAPAITSFVGGTVEQSRGLVDEMRGICAGTSSRFLIPSEEFRGGPLGIDVRKVAAAGVAPVINNGLAHREPGRGQVGAGITRVPIEPFLEAARALDANMKT